MASAAKRESPYVSKSREFSGEKRQLIATNSLLDVLTQIERISNLISSYPARIRTWTKRTKISCATVTLPGIAGLSDFRVLKIPEIWGNLTHFPLFTQVGATFTSGL